MKREYIGTGKTVDEAIEAACAALGCERSEIEFEILALAKKSFFGLRTTPAQVKVTWEDGTPEPRANRPQEGRREKKAEKPAEKPAEKKPGVFARLKKYFRDTKSEVKKVAWPTKQQTINNTLIVIACVIVVGVFIWIFDYIAGSAIDVLLTLLR